MTRQTKLFLSHSSADDSVVRELRKALADQGQEVWIDSRQIRGGDPLWATIRQAIEDASAYAVLVSPDALQSDWVGEELSHALKVQTERGLDRYPVVPLLLDGTRLGVLKQLFGQEPLYVPVSSAPGGIDAALNAILTALGRRLPADRAPDPQPADQPLEELILELTDLRFHEPEPGVRRASARARLIYEPATPGQREVASDKSWRLVAPMGPIELDELRWYLERYAIWPSSHFHARARRVESSLVDWGRALHRAALPPERTANVLAAWSRVEPQAGRRLSIHVDGDATLEDGAPEEARRDARKCATLLLGLPWELLHDGAGFIFQGERPIRVRRRLPNTRPLDVAVVAPPIRILLVSPRPEDDACDYIDHRASALPLADAVESLGGLVELTVLHPPILPALSAALARASAARRPYHVVHFDGHGVYDRQVGLGGLCFEDPQDSDRPERRRHLTVHTDKLGPMLRDRRIPLVILEACQSAQAEQASESVASELLKIGVASVVAMSHSVLVETSRRFVAAFYGALADGKRVGDAMLAGQRVLSDDSSRGRIFGAGELKLQDWFVPVLFQERDDPRLFARLPGAQAREDLRAGLKSRLGALPAPPATGFVGRSRDLLALERQLGTAPAGKRWAVVRGQGGEGKTALAIELARWQVRTHQVRRAAFVSVETHSSAAAVLDALGHQLAGSGYSVAGLRGSDGDLEPAILPVERALREQPTLLVVDNLESVLLPPYLRDETPEAVVEDAADEIAGILALCQRLVACGDTRLVFTSRETLPAPFDDPARLRELARLDTWDAVRLVERVLDSASGGAHDGDAADAARESIERLVDAVHGHARTLALLAPSLSALGVERTRERLAELMAEMDRRFPGNRERSVFASVELSLERLAPANRERAGVLGVFRGGFHLAALQVMTGWELSDCQSLAEDLIRTGLATAGPYGHLTLNPALCPDLHACLGPDVRETLAGRWEESMGAYVAFLVQESDRQAEVAATLTVLEVPNLLALLDRVQGAGEAEATIALATSLYQLMQWLGRPRLLARVGQARDAAAEALARRPGDGWTHARFEAERTRIEQQASGGRPREALAGAEALLKRARAAGELAYPVADYDLAMATKVLAQALNTFGGSERALPLLDEARQQFVNIARERSDRGAERMASVCLAERGACLLDLGRLDESAAVYEESIALDERRGDERGVAVGKGQLGTVRLNQRRYPEALAAYADARERFARLDEPGTVAVYWHQTGMAYQESGNPEAAEDAYRNALATWVRLGNDAHQAGTLTALGNLYDDVLKRPEDAAAFYRQSADLYGGISDLASEGLARSNLAETLRRLRRFDEARREGRRAIDCKANFGHAVEPWKTWNILADIETDAGNPGSAAAARAKALAVFLDYRRAGGENHSDSGRIALAVAERLRAQDPAQARALLAEVAQAPNLPEALRTFLQALDALCAGSRDPALAQTPGLDYTMSAEILLLIETLGPA